MSDRIDHAAEARRFLGLVPASMHTDEVFAVAQVHATLALVEQQRIQNLIAIMACEIAEDKASEFSQATLALYATGKLRPQFAAALGIEEVQS